MSAKQQVLSGWAVLGGALFAVLGLSECGGSPVGGLGSFDAAPIAFGGSPCGSGSAPSKWQIRNDAINGTVLHFSARIEGPFALSGPTGGDLEPGEGRGLVLTPSVPRSTARLATLTGTLIVNTTDPLHPEIRIPLSAVATGAELYFGDPVDLGEVPVAGQLDLPLRIENKGDDAVVVDFGKPDVPTFQTKVPSVQVGAHAANADASFHFQAVSVGPVETMVPVSYRGSICGDPPSSLKLRARGVTGVAVNPGKLDFGLTDCGATAQPQTFKVENTTNKLVTVQLTHQNPAVSTVNIANSSAVVGTTTIAPLSTLVLQVRPNPVPASASTAPNGMGDLLTLTTDLPGDYPHTVSVSQTAYGAILSSAAKTNAGRQIVDANPLATLSLPLTNSGNAAVQVSGATAGNTATFPTTPVAAGATVSVITTVTPDPAKLGHADSRVIGYSVTGPVCGLDQPEVEMTPYDLAVDLDNAGSGVCIAGRTGRIYCTGPNLPTLTQSTPPDVSYLPALVGSRVYLEAGQLWAQSASTLSSTLPSVYKTFTLPSGTGKLYHPTLGGGNSRFCANDSAGQFRCIGINTNSEFGNGLVSGPQWTQWELAMTGLTGITDFSAVGSGSLVVAGGNVYGAGSNVANMFRTGDFGPYPTPVQVAGLANVSRVAASYNGACAVHVGGALSCWSRNGVDTGIHPVVGILDAVEVALDGGVCVIRQNGTVRCSDLAQLPNIWDPPGLALPIQKITPFAALEANGAITGWYGTYPQTFRFKGFEGP